MVFTRTGLSAPLHSCLIGMKELEIQAYGKGRIHDFRLFKSSGVKFGELLKVIADKGYQGITKIHQLSETVIKKPKGTEYERDTSFVTKKYLRHNLQSDHHLLCNLLHFLTQGMIWMA